MTASLNFASLLSSLSQKDISSVSKLSDLETNSDTRGSLVLDSRKIAPKDIFVAISGHETDGRLYIADAFRKGASFCLTEPLTVEQKLNLSNFSDAIVEVESLREKLSVLAAEYLGRPGDRLKCFGVTGTNGKTSVGYFFSQLVESLGKQSAFVGTIGSGKLNRLDTNPLTTPDAIELQRLLYRFVEAEFDYCSMEISSHALCQHRVDAAGIQCAAFLNLSHEHLDYHGSLESYYQAKKRLFLLPGIRQTIINIDDVFGQRLFEELTSESNALLWTVSSNNTMPKVSINPNRHLQLIRRVSKQGLPTQLTCRFGDKDFSTETVLIGDFNINNLLISVLALHSFGDYNLELIFKEVEKLRPPPGRLECFSLAGRVRVFIDYAHTPDALEKVLHALRPEVAERIIVVFGCGGERDKEKRPQMAKVAEQLSDYCIVTDDNPRKESSKQIIDDICHGFSSQEKVLIEPDRKSAIQRAAAMAKAGDVILIAGKGHEDYQILGDKKYAYSDRAVVSSLVEEMQGG